MTTTTKTYYDKVTVTLEEKALLKAVYEMVMDIYKDTGMRGTYSFSTTLDMIMSDIIDANETDIDGDYVVELKEYYE